MVKIQGHRGARGYWPENTLPSIMAAVEGGVPIIEVDLLTTRDGEIVIHHEFFVNSDLCTYMDGGPILDSSLISELTCADIRKIDCGAKAHRKFHRQQEIPGTPIPTLKDLFTALKESQNPYAKSVQLNLEIKADPANPSFILDRSTLVRTIINLVSQNEFTHRVYYSSFDANILSEVRRLDPKAILGFIFDAETLAYAHIPSQGWSDAVLKIATDLQAKMISPEYVLLHKNEIHRLQSAGFKVVTWTVNDCDICMKLIANGVDDIITDYPIELMRLLS